MTDKTATELERDRVAALNPDTNDTPVTPAADTPAAGDDDPADGDAEEEDDKSGAADGDEEEADETEGADGDDDPADEGLDPKDKEIAKLKRAQERMQKRIDKEVGRRKATAKELTDAKAALEDKAADGETFTKAEVEAEAKRIAAETLKAEEFDKAVDRVAKAAVAIDKKEGLSKINEMADEIGPIPGVMIGILDDLENGGAVLLHLADNTDEAEDIYKLSPAKMGVKLAALSEKIKAKTKVPPKPVSQVPDPNKPLGGRGQHARTSLNDSMTDEQWIAQRNADRKAAGKKF